MQGGDREPARGLRARRRDRSSGPLRPGRARASGSLHPAHAGPSLRRPGLYRTGGASSSVDGGPGGSLGALRGSRGRRRFACSRLGAGGVLPPGRGARSAGSGRSVRPLRVGGPRRPGRPGLRSTASAGGRFDVTAGAIGPSALRARGRFGGGPVVLQPESPGGLLERGPLPGPDLRLRPFRDAAYACAVGRRRRAPSPGSLPPGIAWSHRRPPHGPPGLRSPRIPRLLPTGQDDHDRRPSGVRPGCRGRAGRAFRALRGSVPLRPRGHLEGHQRDDRRAAASRVRPRDVSARLDAVQLPGR